ncbi:FecCD family ABC transporter permease [Thaumasiovibrio subtropicus]|uniref:FecCD family ABC transporter permease n=1 Tax=Thaumasiovibrio subtropicus TaxID=1891207 RepID=UPI000B34CA5F|nr:iron chelate uptake ABC transporter family permease subunit [Thaumasiovibrio subtropicus]
MSKISIPYFEGRLWQVGPLSLVISTRQLMVHAILLLLALAVAFYSMTLGRIEVATLQVIDIVLGNGDGGMVERIVMNVRLPRILTALFVGAALGISGAIFQSISRNALGSPDVIGFTTGAASGALMQIVIFGGGALAVSSSAIAGGLITAMAVYLLSMKSGSVGGYRLILTGIGIGAVLSAFNGLLLVKGTIDDAILASLWLSGSLHGRTWMHVFPVMLGVIVLLPIAISMGKQLSLTEMGDDLAMQLGVSVERCRFVMILCAVVLAALATGAAGPIAFIALAAPQLVRRLLRDHNLPLVGSALMGACLLLFANLFIQLLPLNMTVPVGRVTGIIGGLYLIWLLTRRH